jgi:fumarate hydratase subunit alpha
MREIDVNVVQERVRQAVQEINMHTPEPVMIQLTEILDTEISPAGQAAMQDIVENRKVASSRQMPMCQDTGMVVFFVELGQDVHLTGGKLYDALNAAVEVGYEDGYLRKSVVAEPLFERKNTGDNTPPVIHVELVEDEQFALTIAAKGFGAENMSYAKVLTPAQGIEGVKAEVVRCVEEAGPNACPPVTVGVGLGGTLELATVLAKKALMRDPGNRHPEERYAQLELELLELINQTGIGPQGWGGIHTAADVRVEFYPTHIAAIPIAINLDCHLQRHIRLEF